MLNQYETVFILTPVLSDDQVKEAVKKYQKHLKEKGAEIVYEYNWGMRKLAYPVQKKSTGFYGLDIDRTEETIFFFLHEQIDIGNYLKLIQRSLNEK